MDDQQVTTAIKSDLSWIQKHERILIVLFVLLFGAWGLHKWDDIHAADKKAEAAISAQQLADQKTMNAETAKMVQDSIAQYQNMVDKLSQQNSALTIAMSQRTIVLQSQQSVNNALPLPDLAKRWRELAGISAGDITAGNAGITVSDAGARQTTNKLEMLPVLDADLQDQKTITGNVQQELGKADDVIAQQKLQVDGLNRQIVDADKACKDQVASVKADARKSKGKWFVAGAVLGAIAKVALKALL